MPNITRGPKLGKIINANIGDSYPDDFRNLLRSFDALVQGSVLDISLLAPPPLPANGDAYIIPTGATGIWSSYQNAVAVYSTEITVNGTNTKTPGWEFYAPKVGWQFYVATLKLPYVFDGSTWGTVTAGKAIVPSQKLVTANYTVTGADNIVFVDATTGNLTVMLPAVNPLVKGQAVTVKRVDSSVNTSTITAAPGQFIDGQASCTLNIQAQLTLVTNGVGWFVIAGVPGINSYRSNGINVQGNVRVGAGLWFAGDAVILSNVDPSGVNNPNGPITLIGNTTVTGTFHTNGQSMVQGLTVAGPTQINSDVAVSGQIILNGSEYVGGGYHTAGDISSNSDITTYGKITTKAAITSLYNAITAPVLQGAVVPVQNTVTTSTYALASDGSSGTIFADATANPIAISLPVAVPNILTPSIVNYTGKVAKAPEISTRPIPLGMVVTIKKIDASVNAVTITPPPSVDLGPLIKMRAVDGATIVPPLAGGSGSLLGSSTPDTTLSHYTAITNGVLSIIVDSVPTTIVSVNLSGAGDLNGVAAVIQGHLPAVTFVWSGSQFIATNVVVSGTMGYVIAPTLLPSTIDGQANYILQSQWEEVQFQTDGHNWLVLNRTYPGITTDGAGGLHVGGNLRIGDVSTGLLIHTSAGGIILTNPTPLIPLKVIGALEIDGTTKLVGNTEIDGNTNFQGNGTFSGTLTIAGTTNCQSVVTQGPVTVNGAITSNAGITVTSDIISTGSSITAPIIQGALVPSQITVTADYSISIDGSDGTIFADATIAAVNVTLPIAAPNILNGAIRAIPIGMMVTVKKTDASINTVTITPTTGQTIDGQPTYVLSTRYKYVRMQTDGANWFVIGNN